MIHAMSKPKQEKAADPSTEKAKPADEQAKIDINTLDLRLEKVEERISPSETNVFDK